MKCTFENAARNMTAQNAAETGIDNTIQSQAGLSVKISGVAALLCLAIAAHGEIPELCEGLEVLNPHNPHKQHVSMSLGAAEAVTPRHRKQKGQPGHLPSDTWTHRPHACSRLGVCAAQIRGWITERGGM